MNKDLLENLFTLWSRLSRHGDGEKTTGGMLERYHWFLHNSEYKEDCQYTKKCQDLFLRTDYEDIKKLFLECLAAFRQVEGDTFGR